MERSDTLSGTLLDTLPGALVRELDELCTHYPDRRAALIPAVHRCQEELGGWVAPGTMEALAAYFDMEPVEVYGVVSFYPMFRLSPPGDHVVSVCHNVACDLRGARDVVARVCATTGARVHGTSPDGRFTVETVECQGACASAPMLDLDGTFYEELDDAKIETILTGSDADRARLATAGRPSTGGGEHETYLLSRCFEERSHELESARKLGAYEALEKVLETPLSPAEVIDLVKDSGLRGRGGAGFPTGLKWSFMPDPAKDSRPRYLAVNADESEPGTCKDRVLMERDPHGLIEGILIACQAMRIRTAYVYVRGEYRTSYDRLAAAIEEARAAGLVGEGILGTDFACDIWMHKGAGAYICGEETGLMESLEGKRGHPRPKPPFPAGSGLWGNPTTVNNVETLFNVPFIVARGAAWYRAMGTEKSPGNILCGVSGCVERPGVFEVPLGTPARALVEQYAGGVWKGRKLGMWFPGGSSTGMLPPDLVGTKLDHDSLKDAGSMLGTAAMIVLDDRSCPVRALEVILRFYEHESCGQCSQCREGTQWLYQIAHRIETGSGREEDVELLSSLASGMAPGKTICALADAAAIPTHLGIKHLSDVLLEHVRRGGCPYAESASPERAAVTAGA